MEQFHPSNLDMGARFRDSIRGGTFSTERLNLGQRILKSALEKHGDEALTKENFHKVMEHAHKDPHWKNMYSAGPEFETVLREHLKMPEEHHASITSSPSVSSKSMSDESMSARKDDGSEA